MYNKIHIGDKYGYLTIIGKTSERRHGGTIVWKCQCDCGNIVHRSTDVIMRSLLQGYVISCGCKRDKSIGMKYANDKNRIDKAREGMGQIDGTTISSIDRKKLNKNNKSGVRGVCFKSREQKWQADITLRGKPIGRQYFDKKEDAIAWRKFLEEEYYEPIKDEYRREKYKESIEESKE